ncbi:MAG: DUF4175 family protein, partial [Candidatus Eisenbacteria bacterium]
ALNPSLFSLLSAPFEGSVSIAVEPGDVEVEPGGYVDVRVITRGSALRPGLRVKRGLGPWKDIDLRKSHKLTSEPASNFEARLEDIQTTTRYVAVLEREKTRESTISLKTPPQVSDFLIAYDYPRYTGLERRVVPTVVGDLLGFRGTDVQIDVTFTRDVASAALVFGDRTTRAMESRSDKSYSAGFSIFRDGSYRVSATDGRGREHRSPPFDIRCQEDLSPFIKIVSPAPEASVDEGMEIPLDAVCADDFGLSALYLHYFRDPGEVRREEVKEFKDRTREAVVSYLWDLSPLQMLPGEIVTYFLEIFDNDEVSGPKFARTPLMTVRFPTLAELYTEVEEEHEQRVVELEEMLEDAAALREGLEKAVREMKHEQDVTWERQKQVEQVQKSYAEMIEKLEKTSRSLEDNMNKLESYDPTSWELVEKIAEIRKLLDEVQSPELKRAIQRLQQALEKMDISEMQKALAEYAVSQEELLKGLDRAIELLKQIRLEEKLRAAAEEASHLAEKETGVCRSMEGKSPDLDQLAKEQSDLGGSLEELQKRLEELAEQVDEEELARMLQELSQSVGKGGLLDMVSQSVSMMCSKNTPGLKRLLHAIEDQLYQAADRLTAAQAERSSQQFADVTNKVRRIMRELVELSMAQEALAGAVGKGAHTELAKREQTMLDGTMSVANRLLEISKETYFMSHRTSADLGYAIAEMERAVRSLEQKDLPQAEGAGRKAYETLNSVLSSLLIAEQSMCSGQGGMGVGQGFQRMRTLSGVQMGVNRATEELHSQIDRQGRLRESEQQALSRIAAQQEAVRKGLEDVARAMGERRDILGRLDDLINDMKQVEGRMEVQQLDDSMVRKQHQILSRLLEAHKSVQQRDYTGKRYSKPGSDFPDRATPVELPRELLTRKDKLKLDALRERAERYPEAYRELVEEYLRAISAAAK